MKPDPNLMSGYISPPCFTEEIVTRKKQKRSDHKYEIQLTAHAGQNLFFIQQALNSNSVRTTNFALHPPEILVASYNRLH
jgi:hypothetical protein